MRGPLLGALALLAVSLPARGEEITFSLFSSLEWDNNIFNSERDEEDSFVIRAGPSVEVRRPQGDLTYLLRYEPRYEYFLEESEIAAWDHNAYATFEYRLGGRTRIFGQDHFVFTRSLNRISILDPATAAEVDVETRRERIQRNDVSLGLARDLTPRLTGTVQLGHQYFRTSNENQFDSDSLNATAQLGYALSERDRVGGGLGVTRQSFDETSTQPGSSTLFYQLFGSWLHLFDPTLSLELAAGPTYVDAEQDAGTEVVRVQQFPFRESGGLLFPIDPTTCDRLDDGTPFLGGACGITGDVVFGPDATFLRSQRVTLFRADDADDSDSRLTFFGSIELRKRWESVEASLLYRRSESTFSGVGTSAVLDLVSLRTRWIPRRHWTVALTAAWAQRKSATEQTVSVVTLSQSDFPALGLTGIAESTAFRAAKFDDAVDITSYRAGLRVERAIGRRLQAFGTVNYLKQQSEGGFFTRIGDLDDLRVLLGFRYDFDPLRV